jgi:hypothetical protein
MAKADEEEFAPRKTTTYNKFEGMASQNERYNVKQQELFWLENIMRTAPHKLSSVPGPTLKAHFPGWLPPPWHIIPPGSCPTCPCLTTDQGDPNILIAHSAIATVPCSRFIQTETCADIVQFSQARFENVVVGNPLSGPTVRVLAGSTPTVFTGYGLIYDPGATTLSIVKWLAAPLITMGTVLSSQSATLNPGDVLALIAQTVGGANQLLALINGVLQAALTVTDSDIATTNLWAGFIVVGNTDADDRMEWDLLSADCSSILVSIPPGYDCLTDDPDNPVIQCLPEPCSTLDCEHPVDLQVCGGVGPFVWEVLSGDATVVSTGERRATVTHGPRQPIAPAFAPIFEEDIVVSLNPVIGPGCPNPLGSEIIFAVGRVCRDCNGVTVACGTRTVKGRHNLHVIADGSVICDPVPQPIHADFVCTGLSACTAHLQVDGLVLTVSVADVAGGVGDNGPNLNSGSAVFTVSGVSQQQVLYTSDTRDQEQIDFGCTECDLGLVVVQVTDANSVSTTMEF